MIVLDTGGLYAALDANERLHAGAMAALLRVAPPRVLSPFVLAELDYLVATRVGHAAQLVLADEVLRGSYQLEPFTPEDLGLARRLMEKYGDLRIDFADASVVVLANRHRTTDLLCTDERHFRTLRNSSGKPFRLLPLDSQA